MSIHIPVAITIELDDLLTGATGMSVYTLYKKDHNVNKKH